MQAQKTVEKMSADEVEAFAEQVKDQEAILENEDNLGTTLQDEDQLRRSVNKGKRILARDTQLIPQSSGQRDAIKKEIDRLVDIVVGEMPTVREMNYQLGTSESDMAIRKNMAFQKKWTPTLLRIKDLKRRLDPDDPQAGNLERIRPK